MNVKLIRLFRKFHRFLGIIVFLPVTLTVLTGMAATMLEEWTFLNIDVSRSLILSIHTGEIFKLQAFYPILNGIGIIGLLVTGISMTGLFGRRSPVKKELEE